MKLKKILALIGAILGSVLTIHYYLGYTIKNDALACTTEFNFVRNKGTENEVVVNTITQFYFHRDGTGLTTYKGAANADGEILIIDRDVNFTWKQRADDKIIILTYIKTTRRHNDNTPDDKWGKFANPTSRYYLTISELAHSVWLIQDRYYPTYICREN